MTPTIGSRFDVLLDGTGRADDPINNAEMDVNVANFMVSLCDVWFVF